MNKKIVIGLTGQTGAGKTTFSRLLARAGAGIIDADLVAREITAEKDVLEKLQSAFGDDIVKNGSLERRELARRAFSSKEKTRLLTEITQPPTVERILEIKDDFFENGRDTVVIDAISLFENSDKIGFDLSACVICPAEIRLKRIVGRDSVSRADAMLRINAQRPENYYIRRADVVLRNFPPHEPNDELKKLLLAAERIRR